MSGRTIIPISAHPQIGKIGEAEYFRLYEHSLADPDRFWSEHGKRIDWIKPFTKVRNASFEGDVHIAWYEDGTLNASYNCIDRHLPRRTEQTAILWEGDDPGEDRRVTYRELHDAVCRFANVLKARGVKKGDRVTIYLPMIPEIAVAMLACARIGAIHSVVFGGFSPDSLVGRIQDCRSTVLITSDEGRRGGRAIPLKRNADNALRHCPEVRDVIVVRHTGGAVDWVEGRDLWYHEACAAAARYLGSAMPTTRCGTARRCATSSSSVTPAVRSTGSKAGTSGTMRLAPQPRPTARRRKCRPRTRSSSFTHRARPDSRKEYCTPPAAISSTHR